MKDNYWIPLFIVGSGRSGSTFFSALLNGAEEIYFPYETSFIAKAYYFYFRKKEFSEKDYEVISNLFRITTTHGGWGMSSDEIYKTLLEEHPQNYKEVNNVIYNYYLQKVGISKLQYLGLRRPQMIAHKKRIRNVYKNSKFIHLIRDGRDVYLSYKSLHENDSHPFGPRSLVMNAFYWIDIVSRYKTDENAISIKYEDLIQKPKIILKDLETFLDVENMQNASEDYILKQDKSAVTKHQLKGINKKVYQGVDKKNKMKYLHKMSKFQLFIFEMIAGHYLKKNDYPLLFGNFYLFFLPLVILPYFIFFISNNIRYYLREKKSFNKALALSI